ncbi:hypothetical protein [Nocardioides marmoribigeumensis]|uniref:HNH endonuclease n=1 Tax=Nocardioides marmoribigeumensis TaxID=433649 RepID=A0ABU2BW91_9ACTN|nr:hypothetical protein [Nocardioides marmoribigeumensis]MDR7362546.1 hypothetical protein [Nocardioides marmoribigeumensis]
MGMVVSEFAAPTLGALIGVGSWAAGSQIDDALNLRHRHPRLDALVKAGKVPVWQARRVATATAKAEVDDDDARAVDAATAADLARFAVPPGDGGRGGGVAAGAVLDDGAAAAPGPDSYDVPAHIRESVRLRHPVEQFPHGRQASPTCDLDHLRTYDHRPTGPPGQSNTANLHPLGRRHHRTKTHGHWQTHPLTDEQALLTGSLWRAPTGHWFLVDHLGTHDLGRPVEVPRPA